MSSGPKATGSAVVPGTHDDDVTYSPNGFNVNPGSLTMVDGSLTRTLEFDGALTSATELKSLTIKTFAGQPCVGQKYPGLFGYPVSPTNWKQRVTNAVIAFGDNRTAKFGDGTTASVATWSLRMRGAHRFVRTK